MRDSSALIYAVMSGSSGMLGSLRQASSLVPHSYRELQKGITMFSMKGKDKGRQQSGMDIDKAEFRPVGTIRSVLKLRSEAPKQGAEGAPDAWLEINSFAARGIEGISVGDELLILTWLHRARRDVLRVHPRSDPKRRLTGVFATRSPDRPNPVGLHRVTVR